MIFLNIFDNHWITEHFLYFAILMGAISIVLLVMILIRVSKSIKEIDKRKRKSTVDYMRTTSKHIKKERKQLKF